MRNENGKEPDDEENQLTYQQAYRAFVSALKRRGFRGTVLYWYNVAAKRPLDCTKRPTAEELDRARVNLGYLNPRTRYTDPEHAMKLMAGGFLKRWAKTHPGETPPDEEEARRRIQSILHVSTTPHRGGFKRI